MGAGPGATRFFFSKNSNTALPAIIAARKARPFAEPVPARTSAGPGQMPASPQPTPNTRLPKMTRLSMRRALGSSTGAPSSVQVLFPLTPKAPPPTPPPPAIPTPAVAGADSPRRSRCRQRGEPRVDPDLRQRGEDAPGERRGDQARDEGDTPGDVAGLRAREAAENAADARDAAVQHDEEGRSGADHRTAHQGRCGGECVPGDRHGWTSSLIQSEAIWALPAFLSRRSF